jgi:hypothetical protein
MLSCSTSCKFDAIALVAHCQAKHLEETQLSCGEEVVAKAVGKLWSPGFTRTVAGTAIEQVSDPGDNIINCFLL